MIESKKFRDIKGTRNSIYESTFKGIKMKVKIKVDGKIITRSVKQEQFGNFVMNIVRYKNNNYLIGDGDEYIREGYNQTFTLGRRL